MLLGTVVTAPVSPYLGRDGRLVVLPSDEHVGAGAGKNIVETLEEGAFLGAIRTTVARPDNLNGAVGSRFGSWHLDEARTSRDKVWYRSMPRTR